MKIAEIRKRFEIFNQLIFDNVLPAVPITTSNAKSFLGRLEYKIHYSLFRSKKYTDIRIKISTQFNLTDNETEDVLIHEMIHLYILVKQIKDTSAHGKIFRSIMHDINSTHKRNIQISHKKTFIPPTLQRQLSVALVTFYDGKRGIVVCNPKDVEKIQYKIHQRYNTKSVEWHTTNDSHFSIYPISRNGTIYKIKNEEQLMVLLIKNH